MMAIQKPSPSYAEIGAFEKHLKPDPDPRTDVKRSLFPLAVHTVQFTSVGTVVAYVLVSSGAKLYPENESLTTLERTRRHILECVPSANVDIRPFRWFNRELIAAEWTV